MSATVATGEREVAVRMLVPKPGPRNLKRGTRREAPVADVIIP